jgi:hypothetical protein
MGKIKSVPSAQVPAGSNLNEFRVSLKDLSNKPYPAVKSSGVKIRGTGAATKGTMARGPMA